MISLLERAIAQLRNLPEEEQDAAADVLFAYVSSDERHYHLRTDQIKDARRIRRALGNGTRRLATIAKDSAAKNTD